MCLVFVAEQGRTAGGQPRRMHRRKFSDHSSKHGRRFSFRSTHTIELPMLQTCISLPTTQGAYDVSRTLYPSTFQLPFLVMPRACPRPRYTGISLQASDRDRALQQRHKPPFLSRSVEQNARALNPPPPPKKHNKHLRWLL